MARDTNEVDLGVVLKQVRVELGLNQTQVGVAMGFPERGAQTAVSQRERADHPRYIDASVKEIARFEDAYNLQRGTVLRRAGYVVDADTPLDQIDSWTFVPAALREGIKRSIADLWEQAGRPGLSPRRR